MKFFRKTGTAILLLTGVALACMGPVNIQGVALNNGEEINFKRIEELGTDGIAYLKDFGYKSVHYRYRSTHPNVMVFLSSDSSGFGGYTVFNSVGIKVEGTLFNKLEAGDFSREIFSFTDQVKTELLRMRELKIINLSDEEIDKAISTLTPAMNGGAQYWTREEKALDYNSGFNMDGSPFEPVDGIKEKPSVGNDPGDGCGAPLPYELPFGELGGATAVTAQTGKATVQSCSVTGTGSGFSLKLNSAVKNSGELQLFTPAGRQLINQSIAAGTRELTLPLPETARGIYLMKLSVDGVITNLRVNR